MTIAVTGMRSNKLVDMDIEQLRGWATFMDRAMVASLIATIVAVAALGITTWLSFRFSNAVRAQEYAAIHRYKVEMGKHAADLEQEVSRARERTLELEQAVSEADARAADEQRATERAVEAKAMVTAQLANVERLDAAVAEMRAALLAMRDGNVALGAALGAEAHQCIHDFNLKLPIMIDTALAIGGFQFKSMPFVARDAEGLPDLAACRLAPLYPAGWLLRVAGAA